MTNRSGYVDDLDDTWAHIRWRGAVASAMRGKRGQKFLVEMLAAMDALPIKELTIHSLDDGANVCALGSVAKARNIDVSAIDPEDYERVAGAIDLNSTLAREIMWLNDEAGPSDETPAQRFDRMRRWIVRNVGWS